MSNTPIISEQTVQRFHVQPGHVTNRESVYQAIDTERLYQAGLVRHDVKLQVPMEQLAIIEQICAEMKSCWYHYASTIRQPGEHPMDFMRKIAAVAVRCMEQHGAPERQLPAPPAGPDAPTPAPGPQGPQGPQASSPQGK